MQSDMRDAFEHFAHGNLLINRSDFESIIHNFGFNYVTQREKEDFLVKLDSNYFKRTGFDYEFLERVINMKWYRAGGQKA